MCFFWYFLLMVYVCLSLFLVDRCWFFKVFTSRELSWSQLVDVWQSGVEPRHVFETRGASLGWTHQCPGPQVQRLGFPSLGAGAVGSEAKDLAALVSVGPWNLEAVVKPFLNAKKKPEICIICNIFHHISQPEADIYSKSSMPMKQLET